jgi:tetratricopeptide (TPR) repeat protein
MTKQHSQLEETELGTQIEKAWEGLKQGPSRSTLIYLGVGLGIVLLYLVGRWLWTSSEEASSHRWMAFDELVFPQQAPELLQQGDLKGTTQARLGQYIEARLKLRDGLRNLAANKDAIKQVEEGTKLYEELYKSEKIPLLRQEALWGAAKGYETLNNRDEAIKLYRQLSKEYPDSALARDGVVQMKRLEDKNREPDFEALGARLAPKSP